jgi:hypothetical protein
LAFVEDIAGYPDIVRFFFYEHLVVVEGIAGYPDLVRLRCFQQAIGNRVVDDPDILGAVNEDGAIRAAGAGYIDVL